MVSVLVWVAFAVLAAAAAAKEGDGTTGDDEVAPADGATVAAVEEEEAAAGSGDAAVTRPTVPSTDARPPAPVLFDSGPPSGVLIVDIDGEITPGMAAFVTRAVDEAAADPAGIDLLVVRVDTFGGRIDSAVQIRDALLEAPVPVVAYVHNRAISAGALITYAADHIVFATAASMGAATPIQIQGGEAVPVEEKVVSYMRAEMRATADANGRRSDVAEAMVDRVVVIADVVDSQTLLTVTTSEALALGVADGVSASLDELLEQVGAASAPKRFVTRNWAEKLAIFITAPAVAGLLMSLGILGIWVEIKTPGFGVPGIIGVLALAAFFFGHMVVHLAGWEEVILLVIGLLLMIVEIFLVPGFGVPGLLGIACFVGAFVLAMIGLPIGVSWEIGAMNLAAFRVFVSLAVVVGAMFLVYRFLPESALPGWLVLRTAIDAESGARSHNDGTNDEALLVGRRGIATTDLRPSGRARVDGRILDVVSRTDWVDKGATVEVVEVAGVRVLVDLVEPPIAHAAPEPAEAAAAAPESFGPSTGAPAPGATTAGSSAADPPRAEPDPAPPNDDPSENLS